MHMHLPQTLARLTSHRDHNPETLTTIDFHGDHYLQTQCTLAFQRFHMAQTHTGIGFQRFICAVTQCPWDSFPSYGKGYIPIHSFLSYFFDILRLPKIFLHFFHLLKCL